MISVKYDGQGTFNVEDNVVKCLGKGAVDGRVCDAS